MPKIVIPRLKHLQVENYDLYPPHPELGPFAHEFVPGVNLIVGINGLGKTTLLNLMFRLLVGPYEPSKADRIRPGRKQASIKHANIDYFRKRVRDEAGTATGTAVFAFGDAKVEVTRSLRDLRLISYRHDGELKKAGVPAADLDKELMKLLCRLSGLDTRDDGMGKQDGGLGGAEELPSYRYDFDFVIRNLVFFLEDKIPLIWNPEGQFVILRILLCGEELSRQIAEARNELLRIDSLYRNKLWVRNSLEDDIEARNKELARQGVAVEQRDLFISELGGVDALREDLENGLMRLQRDIDATDASILRTRAELYDAELRLRDEEAVYFHASFATARPPGDLIVQAMAGHQGCLVCGTRGESAYRRARERLERHCCPVCEETVTEPEGAISFTEVRADGLNQAERRVEELRRRYANLTKAADEVRDEYEAMLDEIGATRERQRELRALLASASGTELAHDELEAKRSQFTAMDIEVKKLNFEFQGLQKRHEALITRAKVDVGKFSDQIVRAFDEYAQKFMIDDCRLRYRTDRKDKVAQSDRQIDWPAFQVELSSGVGNSVTGRNGWDEVSESQKEFIDLAFRMALLSAASGDQPSMLVVETPEASLDAFFMRRAGDLLRQYGTTNRQNVLVVSSNLTSANMIPALLGIGGRDADELDVRKKRIIDLLRRARPTKALEANRTDYESEFRYAIGEEARAGSSPVPAEAGTSFAGGAAVGGSVSGHGGTA